MAPMSVPKDVQFALLGEKGSIFLQPGVLVIGRQKEHCDIVLSLSTRHGKENVYGSF
jgi:hypothetical protein